MLAEKQGYAQNLLLHGTRYRDQVFTIDVFAWFEGFALTSYSVTDYADKFTDKGSVPGDGNYPGGRGRPLCR